MRTSAIRGISNWALCVLAAAIASACTGSSPERSAEPPARDSTPVRVPRADTTGALPPPVLAGDAQWSYRLTGGWLSEMEGYDRELVRLAFTCEWKCSPGDACEGGAEYEFVRDSTTVRS